VASPTDPAVRTLGEDLLETLRDADGVGLAAPQVYVGLSLFLIAPRPNPRYPDAPSVAPEVVINPEVLDRSPELEKGWEGCLSIPGIRGEVPRHSWIDVAYLTIDGSRVERRFEGFEARIFQHEHDHLLGLVFLDRLESPRDIISDKEYRRMIGR
jgi:peptide deformylase